MFRHRQWLRVISLFFVVFSFIILVPNSSQALAVNSNANDYWPLPTAGSNQVYWWKYRWFAKGIADQISECKQTQNQYAAISAQYFNDGAFGTSSSSLLSLSYFKDHKCLYWEPLDDTILRTYIDDYKTSTNSIADLAGIIAQRAFLSAKGHSQWYPYRNSATQCVKVDTTLPDLVDKDPTNTSTRFYKPGVTQPTFNINGRYTQNIGTKNGSNCDYYHSAFAGGYRADFESGGTPIPTYSLIPRVPFNGEIYVSKRPNVGTIYDRQMLYRIGAGDWAGMRSTTHPTTATKIYFEWGMSIRQTSITYQGHPVMYIGFAEPGVNMATGNPDVGACEEWWVAQGIGPIYIARYTDGYKLNNGANWMNNSTVDHCKSYLAVTSNEFNNPETHFDKVGTYMTGYLKLEDYCISDGCKVNY